MNKFGDIFKSLRKKRGLTQEELADEFNRKYHYKFGKSAISQYENNKRIPEVEVLQKWGDFFEVGVDYLLGDTDIRNNFLEIRESTYPYTFKNLVKKRIKIPVLGKVSAGIPIEAIEYIEDYEEINFEMASKGEYFALKIQGSSMEPKFSEGDVVIVRKQSDIESGNIGVVIVDGSDATVKKIIKQENGIMLIASNQSVFPPRFYDNKAINDLPVKILGKVVELRAKF